MRAKIVSLVLSTAVASAVSANQVVLWNTPGSGAEIENSQVGLDGNFIDGGFWR